MASEVVQAPARLDPLRVEGPAPGAKAGVAGPGGARRVGVAEAGAAAPEAVVETAAFTEEVAASVVAAGVGSAMKGVLEATCGAGLLATGAVGAAGAVEGAAQRPGGRERRRVRAGRAGA